MYAKQFQKDQKWPSLLCSRCHCSAEAEPLIGSVNELKQFIVAMPYRMNDLVFLDKIHSM
jgi:hypothetical protein